MRGFPGIVAVALLAAACQQQPVETKVERAWVRLPAAAGRPGAAYFTVRGGSKGDTLLQVSTPAAVRAELHETMDHAGMKSMQPVHDLAVPSGGTLAFAPGGKHVMLFDVGPAVKPGDQVPLALAFASGRKIEVQAKVVGPGDPEPQI
ncbi:MAG: copper chaperone PCu(A)C [Sphingomonas sp.]|uniref:copper chaperone PCu(A)C n=1 Tax=Sphingomonas sp. TaxID=28214 RepID=UPI001B1B8DB1|nr:copper chaperone PCu(A)C [Sphingomonas sp.]MBO9621360.1 copper chaperone PCu(A)C [Sphingomonas sp.]